MNQQLIDGLRAIANGIEANTIRVSSFHQDGRLTRSGEIYEGSFSVEFENAIGGSFAEDDPVCWDDDDDEGQELAEKLNELLTKEVHGD